MPSANEGQTSETLALLARLRAFCFPGGEDAARRIRAIRTTEKGEIRMSPQARWIPFTAEQLTDSTRSSFRWDARINPGKISSAVVTDAYEEGRGRLVIKLGGILPVKKITGPDADKGELQRYFSSIAFCPSALLNHPSLDWTAVGALALRVRDRQDPTGAAIDIDIGDDGRLLGCRADRPAAVGKKAVMTPWFASGADFREWEGLRVPTRLEATWRRAEGPFTYFQAEIVSFAAVRT
jgi:uncharacterized protein DUF6920